MIRKQDIVNKKKLPYAESLAKKVQEFSTNFEHFLSTMNEDVKNQIESYNQGVERLALLGWTIPIGIPPKYILILADKQNKDNDIEESIVQFYTEKNNREMKSLVNSFQKSNDMSKWIPLIEECYWAFENCKYLIVIPSLLTIIEGVLMLKLDLLEENNIRLITPMKESITNRDKDPLDWLAWNSAFTFIKNLFQKSDFSKEKPIYLNRHWILHGRDTPEWQVNDAVRLFNALGVVSLLSKQKKHR